MYACYCLVYCCLVKVICSTLKCMVTWMRCLSTQQTLKQSLTPYRPYPRSILLLCTLRPLSCLPSGWHAQTYGSPRWRRNSPPAAPNRSKPYKIWLHGGSPRQHHCGRGRSSQFVIPSPDKYPALKSALIKTFSKTQSQTDNELLSLSGLGDRKPSAFLRHIRSLNADPETLL